MKKIVSLFLASALVLGSFAACKRDDTEQSASSQPEETNTVYQNGEYTASYTVAANDRTVDYLTVSIDNDEISIKEYYAVEEAAPAGESSEEAASAESSEASSAASSEAAPSETASEPSSSEMTEHEAGAAKQMLSILEEYEAVGKDVEKMEIIESAEEHSYRFIRMMRTILKNAKEGDTTPIKLGKYADGKYESTMPDFNADGWKEYVQLTVKDGVISEITFDAIGKDDSSSRITTDTEANKGQNKPSEYYPEITKNFTEAGEDLSKVFAPTGGATATKAFTKLMTPLLPNMVSGGKTSIIAPKYVNGVYKAEFSDFDEHGWKEYVTIKISNDVVTIREFDAYSKDDKEKLKSEDAEMIASQEEKTGTNPEKYTKSLTEKWAKAENDVTKVENVAGATVSSNNFKLLVGQILATAAIEGDNQNTIQVNRIASKPAA